MIDNYRLNALTHETPRDIRKNNSKGRDKDDLFTQGHAIFNLFDL